MVDCSIKICVKSFADFKFEIGKLVFILAEINSFWEIPNRLYKYI